MSDRTPEMQSPRDASGNVPGDSPVGSLDVTRLGIPMNGMQLEAKDVASQVELAVAALKDATLTMTYFS